MSNSESAGPGRDEPVSLPLDPEEALRALLAVKPREQDANENEAPTE